MRMLILVLLLAGCGQGSSPGVYDMAQGEDGRIGEVAPDFAASDLAADVDLAQLGADLAQAAPDMACTKAADRTFCTADAQCCSGRCDTIEELCLAPGQCLAPESQCTSAAECCFGFKCQHFGTETGQVVNWCCQGSGDPCVTDHDCCIRVNSTGNGFFQPVCTAAGVCQ